MLSHIGCIFCFIVEMVHLVLIEHDLVKGRLLPSAVTQVGKVGLNPVKVESSCS